MLDLLIFMKHEIAKRKLYMSVAKNTLPFNGIWGFP